MRYVEIMVEVLRGISGEVPAILGIITAPVGLVLEGMCIGAVSVFLLLLICTKRLSIKSKKHDQIRVLADAKLNTIEEYVSQAIDNGDISHDEFLLITSERKEFNEAAQRKD